MTSNEVAPLQKLVTTLQYQKSVTEDYVIPSGEMQYSGLLDKMLFNNNSYALTDHCHDQIVQKLEIPNGYYNRMRDGNPLLLATNINSWLGKKEKVKYLLRTFNYSDENVSNVCRAMLSNRYSILDNFDVLIAALEAINKAGIDVEVVKAEVTDKRMYLHIVAPEIHVKATELLDGYLENRSTAVTGKGIISGMVLCNSEVGLGRFECSARAQILNCLNGVHDRDAKFRKTHLGCSLNEGHVVWSEATKNKNYELIVSQVKDAVKTYMSTDYLGNLTTKLLKYKEIPVEHPTGLIEKASFELGIPEGHKENILRFFLKDNDESVFGMMNAFTRETQKMHADRQYEVEAGIFDLLPRLKHMDTPLSKN